jgi:DNA invertase Pin-like site-specific DNA recombinase
MIGIYLRVSSNKQDTASQEPDLKAWAKGQADEVRWYSDTFTGKVDPVNRPGFRKLFADVCSGKVKTVTVWRLDRLGRTAKGLLNLLDEFRARKVNFVSLKEGIDLKTPAGRLLYTILAGVAAFETEVRGERIAAGLQAKKERVAKGLDTWNTGRPKGTPNKATPEVCAAVKEQKAKGLPIAKIAKMFSLSRPTVYSILKS